MSNGQGRDSAGRVVVGACWTHGRRGSEDAIPVTSRPQAEAIDWVCNRWGGFVRYASDGQIPIDNNVIERLLRPVAIGRKQYLP